MIELTHLTRRFGSVAAVDDLSLHVARGELLVLLGASGCGKTTTLKMINRLVEPSSGRVLVDGRDTREEPPHQLRRRIGYVFQEVGLFPHLSVAENVGITPRLLGWPAERVARRVDELLRLVELEPAVGWPGPSRPSPGWCCSTSPSAPSIRSRATACSAGSCACVASSR
jgi:osmoprotectant transport system ATP-binding protein